MNATATAPLSANSTGELYVTGHCAPLRNEVTAFDLDGLRTTTQLRTKTTKLRRKNFNHEKENSVYGIQCEPDRSAQS